MCAEVLHAEVEPFLDPSIRLTLDDLCRASERVDGKRGGECLPERNQAPFVTLKEK